ncbi:MAG: peptidoglycan-binding domain-containing protein, partial [Patescibacteria group bacterium]
MRGRIATVIFLLIGIPALSLAQTSTAELQVKINTLLEQIKVLQDRIAALQGGGAAATSATTSTAPLAGCPLLSRTLGVGARGDDVLQLQQFLRAQGFFTEEPTGYFGPITEAAVGGGGGG